MNENCNYSHRPEELRALRDWDRPLVELGTWCCEEQSRSGRLFLGENPTRSRLWNEDSVKRLESLEGVAITTCDAGAYGAENTQGQPIIKGHKWISNSETILNNLSKNLTPEQKMYCTPLEGKETTASGHYCSGLVHAILDGVKSEARRRHASRFSHKANDVFYAQPVPNVDAWNIILDKIEQRFTNTHKRPFDLGDFDPIRKEIQDLVPWRITRIQAAWTPQARRFPQGVPYTHRGAALRTNAGELEIEAEDLNWISYPKQRFARPVRLGIFFFGYPRQELPESSQDAPDGQPPPPRDDEDHDLPPNQKQMRLTGFNTEIWFEDPSREVDKKLQYSLGRLHVNMGHAPKAELIRMLAASGNLSKKVLAGLDSLRCGSCIRTKNAEATSHRNLLDQLRGLLWGGAPDRHRLLAPH